VRGALLACVGLCGCSLVVDTGPILTDDDAVALELEYETPLYEGLGGKRLSRPVPVILRGVDLEETDWVALVDDYAFVDCDSDEECLDEGTDDDIGCCSGPFVGSDGLGVVLVRLPVLWDENSGQWPMTLAVFRGRRMIGRGTFEVTLVPQKEVSDGEVFELQFSSPGQRAVFSELRVRPGGAVALLGTEPARLRVTHQLELQFAPSEDRRAIIRALAGSCSTCSIGDPGTTNPLVGGGPGLTAGLGGGAVAIQVDGLFDCELPDSVDRDSRSEPLVWAAPDLDSTSDGAGDGAIVFSILGDVEVEDGGPALGAGSAGEVRVMSPTLDGLSVPSPLLGPRLAVEPRGRIDSLAGPLPVLTNLAQHTLSIVGDSPAEYFYAVQNKAVDGDGWTELTPAGTELPVTLKPGLNRVCVLFRAPTNGELPAETFEKGQCYYSAYLP